MTILDALARAEDYLARHGIDTPRVDAEWLLSHALGLSRVELYTQHDRPLTDAEVTRARCSRGEPGASPLLTSWANGASAA